MMAAEILKGLRRSVPPALFTLLCTFLLGEIIFRIYTPVELPLPGLGRPDSLLGYTMRPGYVGRQRSREYNVKIRTNSFGLRGGEPDTSRTRRNILILGDSFTFGHGVAEEQTYAGRLQAQLDSVQPGVYQVINAGVMGYDNVQELRYLERCCPVFQPVIVVLSVYPANDLLDNLLPEEVRAQNLQGDAENRNFFVRHSRFLWVLRSAAANLKGKARYRRGADSEAMARSQHLLIPEFSGISEPYLAAMDSILAEFGNLAQKHRFLPLVMLIPSRLQFNASDQAFTSKLIPNHTLDFNRPTSLVEAIAVRRGIPCLNLEQCLRGTPTPERCYFRFDKHFNAEGHARTAEFLLREILRIAPFENAAETHPAEGVSDASADPTQGVSPQPAR
jgi:hypothetical protein